MELNYPLRIYRQTVVPIFEEPSWIVVSAQDNIAQELRYARFSRSWKEAPTFYTDVSLRVECAQIVPRPSQKRILAL